MNKMRDLDVFKKFAESFAKKAGKIMLRNFKLGMAKQWKSDNTPVTETDLVMSSYITIK